MKVDFENDEKLIMHILLEDATNASKSNKEVYKHGKRIIGKIHFTNPTLNLKVSELIIIHDILVHSITLLDKYEIPENETPAQKDARDGNAVIMEKLKLHLRDILNVKTEEI